MFTLQGSLLGASFEAHLATRSMARNGWTIAVPLWSTEKRSTFPGAKHPWNQPNPQIQAAEIIPYFSYLFLISYNGLSVFRKLQLRPRYGFKPDVGDLRDGLRISCSKQKSDHPRTPVTRIHHFNTGVVFWFEFYISDLKSLLIDYLLILMDHVEYPSFAMFVGCGFKLSVLRRMAWQKWNSSSRRCPKAKQRPFSCGHGTRGWPMGRLDEGMKACTFNVIWICNV